MNNDPLPKLQPPGEIPKKFRSLPSDVEIPLPFRVESPPMPPRILLLAGEESGDAHGAALARALRAAEPGVEIEAWGGRRLREAGVLVHEDVVEQAVMGLWAVLGKISYFHDLYLRICRRIREWRP